MYILNKFHEFANGDRTGWEDNSYDSEGCSCSHCWLADQHPLFETLDAALYQAAIGIDAHPHASTVYLDGRQDLRLTYEIVPTEDGKVELRADPRALMDWEGRPQVLYELAPPQPASFERVLEWQADVIIQTELARLAGIESEKRIADRNQLVDYYSAVEHVYQEALNDWFGNTELVGGPPPDMVLLLSEERCRVESALAGSPTHAMWCWCPGQRD